MKTDLREFIRQMVERADIVEIIGAQVKLERKGANFFGLCPFHTEKTPSFSVNANNNYFHCFGCGASGDALGFVVRHQCGGDFMLGVESLARILGMAMPELRAGGGGRAATDATREVLQAACDHWQKNLAKTPAAIDYLKKRGINGATAKKYQIGYAADSFEDLCRALAKHGRQKLLAAGLAREKNGRLYDYFHARLMFPIGEANGRIVGFGGRTLGESEPKYLNSAEGAVFSKRRLLYGLAQAQKLAREKKRLLVCEGYMDVVMLSQAGFGEAVATMGTAATAAQMQKALRLAPNVVFAFDGDEAGAKGALRALEGTLAAIKDGASARFVFLPAGEDPDSYTRKNGAQAFEALIAQGKPLADFMPEALWRAAEAQDADGKKTTLMKEGERLLRLVGVDRAPYWRQLLGERLAARAGLAAGGLQRAVAAAPRRRPAGGGNNANKRMDPADNLFLLLCCLSAEPRLISRFEGETVPLLGAPEDAEVVSLALAKLRWNMDDDPPSVAETLEAAGYFVAAKQVRETVRRRFAVAKNVEADMDALIANLKRKERRAAGVGKQNWLKKLSAQMQEPAPPPPAD